MMGVGETVLLTTITIVFQVRYTVFLNEFILLSGQESIVECSAEPAVPCASSKFSSTTNNAVQEIAMWILRL